MRRAIFIFLFFTLLCNMALYGGRHGETKRVAILDIIDRENAVADGVKMLISGKLSFAITNIPGYEGYDRVDIAAIMDEQKFQRTGLVDDSQIKQLGIMTGADYVLVTEVAKLDDREIVIASKILDVESAKIENAADVRTSVDVNTMEAKCRELAKKLFRWTPAAESIKSDIPFVSVEQMPMFQGGDANAFLRWVNKNVIYPQAAIENNIYGRVTVKFVIRKDGALADIEILDSPDKILSDAAIEVLGRSPEWEPGRQNGLAVDVQLTMPVVFKLTGGDGDAKNASGKR